MIKKRSIIAVLAFGLFFGALASKGYAFGGLMVEKLKVNAEVWGTFFSEDFKNIKDVNITVTFYKSGAEVAKKTFTKLEEMQSFDKAMAFDSVQAEGKFTVVKTGSKEATVSLVPNRFTLDPEGTLIQKVLSVPFHVPAGKAAPAGKDEPVGKATPAGTGMREIGGEVIFHFNGKGSSIYLTDIDFVTRASEFEDSDFEHPGLFPNL